MDNDIEQEIKIPSEEEMKKILADATKEIFKKCKENGIPDDRMWFCPKCHYDLNDHFCPKCGTKRHPCLELTCSGCGSSIEVDTGKLPEKCPYCGKEYTENDAKIMVGQA